VIVRQAEAPDVATMAEVASASYRAAFAAILDVEELARRDAASFVPRFTERLADMRVAESGGRVVGFSLVTGAHLDMLFIDPEAQGTGAGRALLDEAVGRGVRTLECFRDNRLARGFYERLGWRLARSYARDFAGAEHHFVFYVLTADEGGMTPT
jgi:ribosomal protein S18 acetylase RimI-like enzyme